VTGKTSRVGETKMEEGFFETCQVWTEYATFPYAVDGGTYYVESSPPKATHCVQELKGSTLRMNKAEANTLLRRHFHWGARSVSPSPPPPAIRTRPA
jgi:hypothetical protein